MQIQYSVILYFYPRVLTLITYIIATHYENVNLMNNIKFKNIILKYVNNCINLFKSIK